MPITHARTSADPVDPGRSRWVPGLGLVACGAACDDQISWPTATRTASDLACVIADGYSVSSWIDGKEKVYGSIP
jgi:hypothetical protein